MKVNFRHYRLLEPQNEEEKRRLLALKGQPARADLFPYYRKDGFKHNLDRSVRPWARGGLTECYIEVGREWVRGMSYCSWSDNFCYERGRKIAFARALKSLAKTLDEKYSDDRIPIDFADALFDDLLDGLTKMGWEAPFLENGGKQYRAAAGHFLNVFLSRAESSDFYAAHQGEEGDSILYNEGVDFARFLARRAWQTSMAFVNGLEYGLSVYNDAPF